MRAPVQNATVPNTAFTAHQKSPPFRIELLHCIDTDVCCFKPECRSLLCLVFPLFSDSVGLCMYAADLG